MKLIIAGSRTIAGNGSLINGAIQHFQLTGKVSEVVSGTASGIDSLGEKWAAHYKIKIKRFPAEWNKYGNSAGPIRNKDMAEYADALLLIWDGLSRGSKSMKTEMQKAKKDIYEVILKQ
jgi:hypothetical protein